MLALCVVAEAVLIGRLAVRVGQQVRRVDALGQSVASAAELADAQGRINQAMATNAKTVAATLGSHRDALAALQCSDQTLWNILVALDLLEETTPTRLTVN